MNFTLVISAAPELQAVLEKIAGNLSGATTSEPETADPKPRKPRTTKETAHVIAPTKPEDDGLGEEPAKVYTVEEIRAIGRENGTRVGVDKVRALIKEMGAESLPKMDASLYNDFVDRVTKLK